MNYPELMQKSIDFIEQNLTSDICVEDAAREAACSLYHYHRVFTALVGITPGEYIRKRRFSCAVHDILFTGDRVLDIAAKYGYESPESFTVHSEKLMGSHLPLQDEYILNLNVLVLLISMKVEF